MADGEWVRQPTYLRKGKWVSGSLQWRERGPKKHSYQQLCPDCQKPIRTISMKGHRVVFDDSPGMRDSKHPCFHWLDNHSKKRDPKTKDFFDE